MTPNACLLCLLEEGQGAEGERLLFVWHSPHGDAAFTPLRDERIWLQQGFFSVYYQVLIIVQTVVACYVNYEVRNRLQEIWDARRHDANVHQG